jgi:hypothetical protein
VDSAGQPVAAAATVSTRHPPRPHGATTCRPWQDPSSDARRGAVELDRPRRSGVPSGQSPFALSTDGGGPMGSARDRSPDPRRPGSPMRPPLSARRHPVSGTAPIRHPPASRQARSRRRSPSMPPATPSPLRSLSRIVRDHASPGGRVRYPDHTGAARSSRSQEHHGLHPCPEPGRTGRPEPGRFPGGSPGRGGERRKPDNTPMKSENAA